MKISTRETILGLGTLTAILIAFTYSMGSTQFAKHREMKQEKVRLERQIKLHQRILDQQSKWQEPLTALQEQLPTYGPRKSVEVELPKTIKRLADKSGLNLPLTQPQGEDQIGTLYELKVRCDWQGSLEQIVRFLYTIHQEGIRFDVRQITIKPVAKKIDQLKGTMVINCAYYRTDSIEEASAQPTK